MVTKMDSGNIHVSFNAPSDSGVTPFFNSITLNTQTRLQAPRRTPMGNASFAYGIEVVQAANRAGDQRWWLIDGDGAEFDYGDLATAPVTPSDAYAMLNRSGAITKGFHAGLILKSRDY